MTLEEGLFYALLLLAFVAYLILRRQDRKFSEAFRREQNRELGKMLLEAFDEAKREEQEAQDKT